MKPPPFVYQPPETPILPIVFSDQHLIVVEKPSGLLSVPGRLDEHKDSLLLRLQAQFEDALTVHRLDMATSGLMVFARGKEAHRALSKTFENRKVDKLYTALVSGVLEGSGKIDLPLITDWPNRPRQKVDHEFGKPSITLWRTISEQQDYSQAELIPVTGRSHQLRVHLAEIGHPILGDKFYADDHAKNASARMCLHASCLSFNHPVNKERLSFRSEPDFPQPNFDIQSFG